jgi:hypothetical protein
MLMFGKWGISFPTKFQHRNTWSYSEEFWAILLIFFLGIIQGKIIEYMKNNKIEHLIF